MIRALTRGACPGLSTPMQAGDGLLVRFLPADPIPLERFACLCEAAQQHGNGTIEISARGSMQVRGLTGDSAPLFAEAVTSLGIELCKPVPVIFDPLPGDPEALIDVSRLCAALRQALAEAGLLLAPKFSIVVDGGGQIDLDALYADIRLQAVTTTEGPKFQLAIAGDAHSATPLAVVAPGEAASAVLSVLKPIADLGRLARGTDLLAAGGIARPSLPQWVRTPRADTVGLHPLKGGRFALGVGLGFGHAHAEVLSEFAAIAHAAGAAWVRPAPRRALLAGPLGEPDAEVIKQEAARLGLVIEARDPRRRIAACPGAPSCLHGIIAARGLAAVLARELALPPGDGIALHVSGCAKGCAHPAPAPLTIVGTERGCGLVQGATARTEPTEYVRESELVSLLTRQKEPAHA